MKQLILTEQLENRIWINDLGSNLIRLKTELIKLYNEHHFDVDTTKFYDSVEFIEFLLDVLEHIEDYDTSGDFFSQLYLQVRNLAQTYKTLEQNREILETAMAAIRKRNIIENTPVKKLTNRVRTTITAEKAWHNLIETNPSNDAFLRIRKNLAQSLGTHLGRITEESRRMADRDSRIAGLKNLKLNDTTLKAINKILSTEKATDFTGTLRQDLAERYGNEAANDTFLDKSSLLGIIGKTKTNEVINCEVSGYKGFQILSYKQYQKNPKYNVLDVLTKNMEGKLHRKTMLIELEKFISGEQVRAWMPSKDGVPRISLLNVHSINPTGSTIPTLIEDTTRKDSFFSNLGNDIKNLFTSAKKRLFER